MSCMTDVLKKPCVSVSKKQNNKKGGASSLQVAFIQNSEL